MDPHDAAPELDPESGLPRSFMRMPLRLQISCWRRGPELVGRQSPYAGILVSLHGASLIGRRRTDSGDRDAAEEVASYLEQQRELRERLAADAGRDPEVRPGLEPRRLEQNRLLLAAWDWMSLAICMPRLPDEVPDVPAGDERVALRMSAGEEGRVVVDPWPFAEPEVEVSAAGRPLEGRFGTSAKLRAALSSADPIRLTATLEPAG